MQILLVKGKILFLPNNKNMATKGLSQPISAMNKSYNETVMYLNSMLSCECVHIYFYSLKTRIKL